MQNKPNFQDVQMNVNSILTKDYERNDIFSVPENKANSNPIKANLLDAQMNITSVLTKDYKNQGRLPAPGKQTQSNPISNPAPLTLARLLKAKEIRMRIRTLLTGVTKIPKFKMSYHEDTD